MSRWNIEPTHRVMLASYITGFVLSIYLTVMAYLLAVYHIASNHVLIGLVALLALIQFVVQLIFFLHLGSDERPRWRLVTFLFMLMVVVILVAGSLWIMANLNYHMNPSDVNHYLQSQDGL